MSELVRVGALADFPEGRGRAVLLDGKRVAVFNLGRGVLRAVQDGCPHMGASLADGLLVERGRAVVCNWHGWRFDLASGRGEAPARSWACVRTYEVQLSGGDVYLRRPAEPAPQPAGVEEPWPVWDGERFVRPSDGLTHGEERSDEADRKPDDEQ